MSGLIRGVLRFGRVLLKAAYTDELMYVYKLPIEHAGPLPWPAPIEQCECHVIEDNAAADALVSQGYDDFRVMIPPARTRLEQGAVAACAYVDKAFASVDWMAFSQRAQRSIDGLPYRVSYEDHHAYTGGALTQPQFRNMGIGTYRLSQQLRYMRDHGSTVSCCVIRTDNVPSQRCVEKHGAQVSRICRQHRFLGWRRWTEHSVK